MWRTVACALLVYLSLDFADPNMPGALNFDLDKSVEAVPSQPRAKLPPAAISVPPVAPSINEAAVFAQAALVRPVIAVARTLPLHLRPRAVLSARVPAAADDH
jgi:hypothetical protein